MLYFFFKKFDVIFIFTWFYLIDLFFCLPHFIDFDFFKRYIKIIFLKREKIF
jgi:hypothetical protein